MKELRFIISNNLSALRKKRGLTQAELAEKIGYSDKAISRWEHGDTLPDITMLYSLCGFYGITLDTLCSEDMKPSEKEEAASPAPDSTEEIEHIGKSDNVDGGKAQPDNESDVAAIVEETEVKKGIHPVISCGLIVSLIWLIAIAFFITVSGKIAHSWLIFLWTVPASLFVMLVFLLRREKHALFFAFSSVFLWVTLVCFYLQFLNKNIWMLFLLGIPLQLIMVNIFIIKLTKAKEVKKNGQK